MQNLVMAFAPIVCRSYILTLFPRKRNRGKSRSQDKEHRRNEIRLLFFHGGKAYDADCSFSSA